MSRIDELNAEFRALRVAANTIIPLAADKPTIINESVALIQRWKPGSAQSPAVWALDDVREYDGIPYRCCQPYTDRGDHPQPPPGLPAHWAQYHGTSVETARPYIQPLGAHDAYQTGEYCTEGGKTYRCKVAATVFPPSTLPASWEAVGSASTESGTESGTETPEPVPVVPEQPAVATWDSLPANHPFKVGDKFSDGGKTYKVKRAFSKQANWRPPALTGDYYVIIS